MKHASLTFLAHKFIYFCFFCCYFCSFGLFATLKQDRAIKLTAPSALGDIYIYICMHVCFMYVCHVILCVYLCASSSFFFYFGTVVRHNCIFKIYDELLVALWALDMGWQCENALN